ncbi:MAG: glycosyltransferase family 39 protein [Bacteroidia bacterium]
MSLKAFGINEFSVRIPSIILHAIITFFIYRIGKIVSNKNVGYYGALFFSVAYYPLELIAGRYSTDHNDIAFLFYVTASFWAWFEYQHTNKKYWLVLIGVFSGCAVLVKWLVGLLVYFAWFISISLTNKIKSFQWQQYLPIIYSMGISILIFLPWQLFIFHTYPKEAEYEFLYNTKHFFEIVEGHGGTIWFHFKAIYTIYGSGDAIPFLLLTGLIILIRTTSLNTYKVFMLSAIIITYGIYSIATTKMISYCLIVSPFAFLGLGALADSILMFLKTKIKATSLKMFISNVGIVAVCIMLLNLAKIQNNHTDWKPKDNHNREVELKEMTFINQLPLISKNNKGVIFNTTISVDGHIPIMFYTSYVAYNFIPNLAQINCAKSQAYKIMILDTGNLPDFIKNDEDILKIKL